jgi:amidase
MSDDLAFTPALEQARLIKDRQVSPVELVELYLRRIERLNPRLNAYLTVAAEQAIDGARASEATIAAGGGGPFEGVPVSIKDLHNTAGIRTTQGSAGLADYVPDTDDAAVAKLKAAGFVVIGKTNTPEFGSAVITEPVAFGPCRNPWDEDRTPGGSSGGAACALAAGLAPISHGSDGGGSIRIPSAWCGVFGIKPSRGRVSAAPAPQNLQSGQGPIARTVADAAAMLDAMAGYVTGDAFWPPPPSRPFLAEVREPPGKLRVAFASTRPDAVVDPDWSVAVEATAALLSDLGHQVTEASPPWTPLDVDHPVIVARCGLMVAIEEDLPPFEVLDPINQKFIEVGRTVSVRDALRGDLIAAQLARSIVAFFDDYDILVTPTNATAPPLVGALRDNDNPWNGLAKSLLACPFTADWNMTGQPAVSIPLFVDSAGLPIGIQIVGRPAAEDVLIRVSAQLEDARPWAARRPPGQ